VLLSLIIQGAFCYLFEYFGANFFLNSGYTMPTAAASPVPIGDMMQIVGTWVFGSPQAGWWFMFIQAITVFLALIGTTLACMNTVFHQKPVQRFEPLIDRKEGGRRSLQ
jgi:basic amino acid/polyamine antiporter, APA family